MKKAHLLSCAAFIGLLVNLGNGSEPDNGDHLVPMPGVLFEGSNRLPDLLKFRQKLMAEIPGEEGMALIQIATDYDGLGQIRDVIVLLQEQPPYTEGPLDYAFIYSRWESSKGRDLDVTSQRIKVDTKIAKRMLSVWKSVLLDTRHRRKTRPTDYYTSEFHSLYTLGEGTMDGAASAMLDADQPILLALREAVVGLRLWIRSDAHDTAAQDRWLGALDRLEKLLKEQ